MAIAIKALITLMPTNKLDNIVSRNTDPSIQ